MVKIDRFRPAARAPATRRPVSGRNLRPKPARAATRAARFMAMETTTKPRAGHLIGYARVSTADQQATAQIDALASAGCVRVFTETAGGASRQRPQLEAALDHLNPGDALVVWRLDRLGRSLQDLLAIVTELGERGVDFISLTESIDTTTATGCLLFHVAGAFAQFERDLIRDRTNMGIAAARAEGRVGGRPTVMTENKLETAKALRAAGRTQAQIADVLSVSRTTVRRVLGELKS